MLCDQGLLKRQAISPSGNLTKQLPPSAMKYKKYVILGLELRHCSTLKHCKKVPTLNFHLRFKNFGCNSIKGTGGVLY